MEDRKMNRSWTIAAASATAGTAALSLGLFLAVGKDTLALNEKDEKDPQDKVVQVVTVSGDDAGRAVCLRDGGEDEARAMKGGYLGLIMREDTASSEGGALVQRVVMDSPSAKAGLKTGDVIVGFGGDVVRGPAKVREKLRATKPGDKVNLDVRRDGKVQKFTVELGKRNSPMAWNVRSGDWAPLDEEQQRALEESLSHLDEKLPDIGKRISKMKLYAPGRHGLMVFGGSKPLLGIEMIETTPELREALGGTKDAGVLRRKGPSRHGRRKVRASRRRPRSLDRRHEGLRYRRALRGDQQA
jgi:membrane-associated protease RseP (regulator of RpoE activity)